MSSVHFKVVKTSSLHLQLAREIIAAPAARKLFAKEVATMTQVSEIKIIREILNSFTNKNISVCKCEHGT